MTVDKTSQSKLNIINHITGDATSKDKKKITIPKNILDSIYMGDVLDFFSKMPSESVDRVVSSPPFNIGKTTNDRMPLEHYLEWQENVLKECFRVLKHTVQFFGKLVHTSARNGSAYSARCKIFSNI